MLFLALRRLTGATWRSGLVAALFCLHPAACRVGGWVAERKDVLSGLFFGLTLWAYAGYVGAGSTEAEGEKGREGEGERGNLTPSASRKGAELSPGVDTGWWSDFLPSDCCANQCW